MAGRQKQVGAARGANLIDGVADWLMGQALAETDFEPLFEGCCERLLAAGVPLWRAHVTFRMLHPLYEAMGLTWLRGRGVETFRYPHRQEAEFPEAVADGVRKAAAGKGLDLVFDDSYAVGVDDLSGFVGKLAQSRPQLIVVGAYLDDAVLFTNALQKNGYSPEMLAFSGAPSLAEFGEALGTAADGVIATTQWMRDGRIPGAFDFGFRYRARFGRYPSYNAAGGYAAGQVLEAATRLAGTVDRAAVRKQLSQMNFHSLLGRYRVDGTGRQVGTPIYLVQWQDGHRSLVYPKEIARWELRFPFPRWDSR